MDEQSPRWGHLDIGIIKMDPDKAQAFLDRNTRNRRVRRDIVEQYARDMAAGKWQLTGESISFDRDGNLIDGQHRLQAIIRSGVTVELTTVWGLDPQVQEVLDTGMKRRAADQLAIRGYKHAALTAAAARLAILYERGRTVTNGPQGAVSHSEIFDYLRRHPELMDVVAQSAVFDHLIDMPRSATAMTFWELWRVDAQPAAEFFGRLADGVNLESGSPILALRSRLRQLKSARTRSDPQVFVSLTFRAWNAWRSGATVSKLPTHRKDQVIRHPRPI